MNANDPRLTAHALGEADAESADTIACDPALAAEAAQIERLASHLRAEFSAEPALPLLDEQRAAVLAAARIAAGPAHWWQRPHAVSAAAAACVLLALGAAVHFQGRYVRDLRSVGGSESVTPRGMTITFADDTRPSHDEPVLPPRVRVVETQPSLSGPAPALLLTHEFTQAAAAESTPKRTASASPTPAKVAPSGTLPADPQRVNAAPLRPSPKPRNR